MLTIPSPKKIADEILKQDVPGFEKAMEQLLRFHHLLFEIASGVKFGDLVYHEGRLQRIVATGYEAGSGPSPSRVFWAFENDPKIIEPPTFWPKKSQIFLVLRPKEDYPK